MNEELDSQLSAMFDDELAHAECELLARRLSRDTDLKARWGRYAVIGAAIRSERGVRLHAQVARRVSAIVVAEPPLEGVTGAPGARLRWWRPVAGVAVAAGVAAVSILWLRAHAPLTGAAPAQLSARATESQPAGSTPVLRPAEAADDRYTVPRQAHAAMAVVPATELANYVVAHSMFSAPVARGNLLSSFITSESGAGANLPVSQEFVQEPPIDASRAAH